jgi:hypothetical protein
MTQTITASRSATYSDIDVQDVVLCLKADLVMIANSTGGMSTGKAEDYAHDIDLLAKGKYLDYVDVTLFSMGVEQKAVRYSVNGNAVNITNRRPGGVLWPRLPSPLMRVVVGYSSRYTQSVHETMKSKLRIPWGWCNADTSHAALSSSGGRDYVSHGFALQRKDWG